MNKKILLIPVIALAILIALSGCITPPPICGNGICEAGETTENCPADCGPKTGSLEVKVIDSVTAEPIPEAIVTITIENWSDAEKTDMTGIALFKSLAPGEYTVTAEKEGYLPTTATTSAKVSAGETTKVTFRFEKTGEFDTIAIGNNKLVYTDAQSIERSIPFYIKLANTSSENTFVISGQTFYYRCSSTDTLVKIKSYDRLNGWVIYLSDTLPRTGSSILFTDIGDVNLAKLAKGTQIYLGGVQFDFQSFDRNTNSFTVLADGNCQFSKHTFSNPEYLEMGEMSPTDMRPLNNTVYYDDDNTARGPTKESLNVTNSAMNDTYTYSMYVERASTNDGSIYLLLSSPAGGGLTDENNAVGLAGTDIKEDGFWGKGWSSPDPFYYWPDTPDFGNASGDTTYLVADFIVATDPLHDVNLNSRIDVYIDTATGNTLTFPNPQLSYYKGCVYWNNKEHYMYCFADIPETVTTYNGSKISVASGVATIQMPIAPTGGGGGGPAPT